jgi:oligosaccharide repeat unit polymerase
MFASLGVTLLTFLPLFLYNKREYGWLHPLLFPTLFSVARDFVKDPSQILSPLHLFEGRTEGVLLNSNLPHLGMDMMAIASVEHDLYRMMALICYYSGFFAARKYIYFNFKPSKLDFATPHRVAYVALVVSLVATLIFLWYIRSHGGLSSYMLSYFGQGRVRTRDGLDGIIFVAVGVGSLACLLWFALDKRAYSNPLFWMTSAFLVPVNFFLTGSRSSIFIAAGMFLVVWMIRNQKIPQIKIFIFGVLALLLIGIMGDFRRATTKGYVDWGVFKEATLGSAYTSTVEDVQSREANTGGVPVIASVPERVGFLYGQSYVGGIAFFIPRILWPSKPESGHRLNARVILGRPDAIPLGSVAEAYWNFGPPGVALIFFLYGVFHMGVARTFTRYSDFPVVWVLYVVVMISIGPSSNQLTTGMRDLVTVVVIATAMGAFQWNTRSVPRSDKLVYNPVSRPKVLSKTRV